MGKERMYLVHQRWAQLGLRVIIAEVLDRTAEKGKGLTPELGVIPLGAECPQWVSQGG